MMPSTRTRSASRSKSTSPSIPRLRNNSKRSILCLTTVVLLVLGYDFRSRMTRWLALGYTDSFTPPPGTLLFQFPAAPVHSPAQLFVGEQCKPALHQVEPGGAGGCEVNMEAGPLGESIPDERRLVGSVVVHNQVYVQVGGHLYLDGIGRSGYRGTCGTPPPGGAGGIGQLPCPTWCPARRTATWCRGERNHGCAARPGPVPSGPVTWAAGAWCDPGPESGTSHQRTSPVHITSARSGGLR